MSGIVFNPYHRHETFPWEGHRITVAVYTVREDHSLQPEHRETLQRLQFVTPAPNADRATIREDSEAETEVHTMPYSEPLRH